MTLITLITLITLTTRITPRYRYWENLSSGVLTQTEMLPLLSLISKAEFQPECEDIRTAPEDILKMMEIPKYLTDAYQTTASDKVCGAMGAKYAGETIFERMFFAFRLGLGYLNAKQVLTFNVCYGAY